MLLKNKPVGYMDRLASNHRNTSHLRHQTKKKRKSKLALFILQSVWPLWIFWNPRKKSFWFFKPQVIELVLTEIFLYSSFLWKQISRFEISGNSRPNSNRNNFGINHTEWTYCPHGERSGPARMQNLLGGSIEESPPVGNQSDRSIQSLSPVSFEESTNRHHFYKRAPVRHWQADFKPTLGVAWYDVNH